MEQDGQFYYGSKASARAGILGSTQKQCKICNTIQPKSYVGKYSNCRKCDLLRQGVTGGKFFKKKRGIRFI